MPLNDVLDLWESEKDRYKYFCDHIVSRLETISKTNGINVSISSRVKEGNSLVRKIFKKTLDIEKKSADDESHLLEIYNKLTDKAGIRIICRFKNEVSIIADLIKEEFEIVLEDNKNEHLRYNEIGYKSYHFDIKIKKNTMDPKNYETIKDILGEIQIRTLCENVWAEIDHDLGYKNSSNVSDEHKRQIHCLGGLLEVADDYVCKIKESIIKQDIINEYSVLLIVEKAFINLIASEYDKEFSLFNMNKFISIIDFDNLNDFKMSFNLFCKNNHQKIERILFINKDKIISNPFFFQPEILLIFYLIDNNKFELIDLWKRFYNLNDLDDISIIWGRPLDELLYCN